MRRANHAAVFVTYLIFGHRLFPIVFGSGTGDYYKRGRGEYGGEVHLAYYEISDVFRNLGINYYPKPHSFGIYF